MSAGRGGSVFAALAHAGRPSFLHPFPKPSHKYANSLRQRQGSKFVTNFNVFRLKGEC